MYTYKTYMYITCTYVLKCTGIYVIAYLHQMKIDCDKPNADKVDYFQDLT